MDKSRAEGGEKSPYPTLSDLPEHYPEHGEKIHEATGKSLDEIRQELMDHINEVQEKKGNHLSLEELREKAEDGKLLIVCPFILAATTEINSDPRGVNYTSNWHGTIQLGDEEVGCWYSMRQERGGSWDREILPAFDQLMEQKKESGEIAWESSGFYFTHEQGLAAREKYEEMVLDGVAKANAKSWNNKHAIFTGVPLEDIKERYAELYKTSTKKKAEVEEAVEVPEDQVIEVTEDIEKEIEAEAPSAYTKPVTFAGSEDDVLDEELAESEEFEEVE